MQTDPLVNRRPTLQDVAKAAGVTPAAVSYVVNGRTDQVGANTLERILAAVKALNYRPQRRGLSLKLNREFAFGLIIFDNESNFLNDPFTTQVATGFSNALLDPGYSLMITGIRNQSDFERFQTRPLAVDAHAVMASGPPDVRQKAYESIQGLGVPLVVIQDSLPDTLLDACAILQDDYGGAQVLTQHLLDRGARNFLLVTSSQNWPGMERREEGIRSMLDSRCTLKRLECNENNHDAVVAIIDKALSDHSLPDAILGGNDQMAIAVLKVLEMRKLRVGCDVKVTGFNNFAFRSYTTPLLTTVASAAHEIGQQTAASLITRMDTGKFSQTVYKFPVSLVLGQTTDLP